MSNNTLTLPQEIQDVLALKEEYRAKLEKLGSEAVGKVLAPFFEKFFEVKSVRWTQYTPYFNDGDSCEFSVHEATIGIPNDKLDLFGLKADDAEEYEQDDNDSETTYYSDYNLHRYEGRTKKYSTPRAEELHDALVQINSTFSQLEDVLQGAFGDHVVVTAFRDKIDVEEHSHD